VTCLAAASQEFGGYGMLEMLVVIGAKASLTYVHEKVATARSFPHDSDLI